MGCECVCACGRRWALPHDLATFTGELALACPACGGGAARLVLGAAAHEQATVPPAYSTDDEVEPELVEEEAPAFGLASRYELLGELGRGGMGVVYKARQKGLNRTVALKMILAADHAGAEALARFRAEAEAIARLRHPNIVAVYDIGDDGGQPYFSLELCAGGSLEKKLRGRPLPPREAAAVVEVLARAIDAAHAAGILHRDLKPANVLLDGDGTPKVTDFGLAKKLDESGQGKTRTGAVMGTPSYMAPEQAEGRKDVGPPADIYALGAILYECLTGRPPFQAASAFDTILQVISEEPVPPRRLNSKVPRDLEVICLKCLDKSPAGRYTTAAEMGDELRRYLDGEPIRARPPGLVRRSWQAMRKRPVYAAFAVLLSAGVLYGVFDYVRMSQAARGWRSGEMQGIWRYLRDGDQTKDLSPSIKK